MHAIAIVKIRDTRRRTGVPSVRAAMAVPAGHGNRQFVDDAQVRAMRCDAMQTMRCDDESYK